MKGSLFGYALLLAPLAAFAQVSNPSIVAVSTSPDGQSCSAQLPIKLKTPDGTLHTCQNGVYGPVAGGGPAFPVPITSPSINGDIYADGVANPTINAAWNVCQGKAANCAIELTAGVYPLTSTLTEPEASYSTSMFGRGSDKTIIGISTTALTNMFFKANTTVGVPFVIQGVTFQCNNGSTINAQNGVKIQWARGIILDDVKVINCGTMDIDLGEDTGTTHQFGGRFYNLQTDYNEGVFTGPAGGSGPTPPAFGMQIRASAGDSDFYGMILRNAHTASLHNDGNAINFYDVHGFGFTSNNTFYLNYIPSYIIEESGTSNNWYGTYADSPSVAAIHFTAAASAVVNDSFLGGKFYWNPSPNGSPVTYPSTDAIMQVDSANVGDLTLAGFSCFNLPNTSNFLIGAGSLGTRTRFDDVTGCSTTFMTYRMSVANRGYNWSDLSASFNLQWQGAEGHFATTANGSSAWNWEDSGRVIRTQMLDNGLLKLPAVSSFGTTFSVSGCSFSAPVGGPTAGTFTSGTTGTCTVTITPGLTASHGWACGANDLTTPADAIKQTASSTTTATLSGATVSGDVVNLWCVAF